MCCELYKYGQAENIHWKKGEPFLPSFLDIITMMDGAILAMLISWHMRTEYMHVVVFSAPCFLTRTSCLAFRIEQKG